MSTALKVIRLVTAGECPVFSANADVSACLRVRAQGKCSLCNFTRSLPKVGRKLILRFWLAHLPDTELLSVLHGTRALGGD